MYKKSFFRGLGTGLVVGALTMTVAFNFDNAGKTDSGQGKTAVVSQQDKDAESQTSDSDKDTKGTTAVSKTTEKAKEDKATTEKAKDDSKVTDKTDTSGVNGKGDVHSDGSNASNAGAADGNGATGNAGTSDGSGKLDGSGTTDGSGKSDGSVTSNGSGSSDSSGTSDGSDKSDGSSTSGGSGKSDGSSTSDGSMSDNTQKVPSSKDNGYTEDKNSQQPSGSTTNDGSGATTEAQKPSAVKYDNGGGQITIVDGMSAYEICQLLEQIGLRDADEYYDWLLRSGYSQSLVSGTYTFTGNETNGGIVWILLGNQ